VAAATKDASAFFKLIPGEKRGRFFEWRRRPGHGRGASIVVLGCGFRVFVPDEGDGRAFNLLRDDLPPEFPAESYNGFGGFG
jgi:hypothetical protein